MKVSTCIRKTFYMSLFKSIIKIELFLNCDIMKKIVLTLICVFMISFSASVAFASDDVDNIAANEATSENQDISVSINHGINSDVPVAENATGEPDDNQINEIGNAGNLNFDNDTVDDSARSYGMYNPDSSSDPSHMNNTETGANEGKSNVTLDYLKGFVDVNSIFGNRNVNMTHSGPVLTHTAPQYCSKLDVKNPDMGNFKINGPHYRPFFNDVWGGIKNPGLSSYGKTAGHYDNILILNPQWNIITCIMSTIDDLYTIYLNGFCSCVANLHDMISENFDGDDLASKDIYNELSIYSHILCY